ncbi:MAG: TetR family transcriptional regulator [Desulfobacteraceae bacterium]|nr:TetR family transcriptional regulator [Desulfobacteraceae bacterium]
MRRKDTEKHRRILDAAVRVFARKGFFRARISEIAREAEVADGTVYLYFKNKDDLLISIFEEKMRDFIAGVRTAMKERPDARFRLLCLIERHLAAFQADPDLAAVFQVELRRSGRFMKDYSKDALKEYLDLIGEVVEQGRREGSFRGDFPAGLARGLIFGTLDEVVSAWVLSGRRSDLTGQGEYIADLLLRGIRREDPSREGP